MSEEGTKVGKTTTQRKKVRVATTKEERKLLERPARPTSLELETDWTNTETKLVVLDFLSVQPIEQLTARNAPANERKKVSKSASDGSSYEPLCRKRYAKLAKSAKPLRKQYSLRLKNDLDEYLRQRGKSVEDLPSYKSSRAASVDESVYMHQRSYTEGDAYFKRSRRMSDELKKGITEFSTSRLKHVANEEKAEKSNQHRPEQLDIPFQRECRISPVLSPESQVAARLELISQDILNTYPDIFDGHMSKVSLQDLTYEKFASTAKKLLEKYPGGWTRVALVCYFARELALEDESTDEQLEHLVEFSSKFISETSAEWIASQGGWGALEGSNEAISPSLVRKKLKEEPDIVDGILDGPGSGWINYAKYGFAALAVGVTVAYQIAK